MVEMHEQRKAKDTELDSEVEDLKRKVEIQNLQGKQLQLELQLKIMEKVSRMADWLSIYRSHFLNRGPGFTLQIGSDVG